ncbi:DoxX family protein [Hymenobacter sp.]|uniref:DoxX family protein n=1 Tax=Hymenobacter sp. TaxID=1898978 RepID=UPI00286D0ECE|nr:DoxX family protein [Hymenobacter sp.]
MKPPTITRLYWGLTILFCLMMFADGIAGLLLEKTGQAYMRQLGYPVYIMTITGAAKALGALALLQPKYRTLKEWAFAGFAIDFIGAAASTAFAGMGLFGMVPALVMLVVLFGLRYLWQRQLAIAAGGAAIPPFISAGYGALAMEPHCAVADV